MLEMSFASKDNTRDTIKRKITNVNSDARPVISEESQPTESDTESEVVCRFNIGQAIRDSDISIGNYHN